MAGCGGSYTDPDNWPKDPTWRGYGPIVAGIFVGLLGIAGIGVVILLICTAL